MKLRFLARTSEYDRQHARGATLRRAVCGLISLLVMAVGGEAFAGGTLYTWDGGANTGNWSDAANWQTAPVWDNQANLNFAGSVQTSATNNVTSTIRNIVFSTGAASFTLSGSAVSLGNAAGVLNSSSNLQTINLSGIILLNNTNFSSVSSQLVISSTITGGFNFLIPATSTGTITLSGSNSFTGSVTMSAGAGALRIADSNALGTIAGGVTITTGGALEPGHPKSCFFHRGADERIVAGPLWDFDWAYDYEGAADDGLMLKEALWFKHLFRDPAFRARVKARWAAVKAAHVDTLPDFVATLAATIRPAVEADRRMWPEDEDVRTPADAAHLRTWLVAHIAALDAAIEALAQ